MEPTKSSTNGIGPVAAHITPFIAWIFLMHMLGDPAGWKYAVRTAVCLGLFLWLKPWRWYAKLDPRNLPLALGMGVAVFVVWVIGESPWTPALLREPYERWLVLPFGELREPLATFPYAPETCGWFLTFMRIFGSAFVIAPIEEFFWRGFLVRWAQGGEFHTKDLGVFHPGAFLIVVFSFGFIHHEWFAGILAGLAYGWMVVKTRDVWAASVAHMLTNLLLGIYVLLTRSYQFW